MKPTIGLVYDLRKDYLENGLSEEDVAEFDSEETINFLYETICSFGYNVERIGNAKSLAQRLVEGCRWDMVFNIAEGLGGRCRESYVPALLDMYGIAYTFSDALVCALTLDKSMAKRIICQAGLPTAAFRVVRTITDLASVDLQYPLFAKPIAEGTGKGITANSKIETSIQLERVCMELLSAYGQPVIVEEFLPGREFTVGILGNGQNARAIGTMEIDILSSDEPGIYSFINKEECSIRVNYIRLEESLLKVEIERLAVESYNALQCRDSGRVDIRCDKNGSPCFIEINPLAGLHPTHSDLCIIAAHEGIEYRQLIGEILQNAFARKEQEAVYQCAM